MKGRYAEAKIYIDDAMKNGGAESDVVVEHCGDIYFMNEMQKKLSDTGNSRKRWGMSRRH